MGIRSSFAAFLGRSAGWAAETFFRRKAGHLPGAIALKADPDVLSTLAKRVDPVMVISGTNGKTTTNNLVADCLATSGIPLVCNREGNNLQGGVVAAILAKHDHSQATPEGSRLPHVCAFECDELYTRFVLPRVKPRFFMLLNLFRDQLDRFGDVERIQDTISEALAKTPNTVFVYNGDDPLCAAIAARVPNKSVAFGIQDNLGEEADEAGEGGFCPQCGGSLGYDFVHYGHLGAYRCSQCGFARSQLAFAATDVRRGENGFEFTIDGQRICTGQSGVYMVYNTLAVYAICKLSGLVGFENFQRCVLAYQPTNGRLQNFQLGNRKVMTNLAKNPVGFNQNVRIALQEQGRVLALFVNDEEGDGLDVSWYWDVDFERLTQIPGLKVFAGGARANDMQVRLKYAGIDAQLVRSAQDVLDATQPEDGKVFIIANYTALPTVRQELEGIQAACAQVAEGEE